MSSGDAGEERDEPNPGDGKLVAENGNIALHRYLRIEVGHRGQRANCKLGHSGADRGGREILSFPVRTAW